jgi:hypothetical protein
MMSTTGASFFDFVSFDDVMGIPLFCDILCHSWPEAGWPGADVPVEPPTGRALGATRTA